MSTTTNYIGEQPMEQSYYERTKEQHLARSKEWNKNNKDKCKAYQKKYLNKIRPRINQYNLNKKREEYNTDAQKRAKAILMAQHKTLMQNKTTMVTEFVGLNYREYKDYIQSLLPEDCTFDNYGKKWQIRRKKSF